MLSSLLLYIGDMQREGSVITARIKTKLVLNILAVFFLVIAFIAAIIGGCIYLADEIGAGPAAFAVAGAGVVLAIIAYIWIAILDGAHNRRRARAQSAVPLAGPLTAASATQVATQAALASVLRNRPYLTLAATVALGFFATRTSLRK